METFDREVLQTEYGRLGFRHGWTFLMTREERLRDAQIAFIGLNPGGGGEKYDHVYAETWDVPEGNAYFIERWGTRDSFSPIQKQVQAWHSALEIGADDSFCAQFIPFRSPDLESLERKSEHWLFQNGCGVGRSNSRQHLYW